MIFTEYDSLTLEELNAEFVRLAPIFTDAANRRNYLIQLIDTRKRAAASTARIRNMSSEDRAALRLAIDEADK